MKNLRLKWLLVAVGFFVMTGTRISFHLTYILSTVTWKGIGYNSLFWILLPLAVTLFLIAGASASFFYENNVEAS